MYRESFEARRGREISEDAGTERSQLLYFADQEPNDLYFWQKARRRRPQAPNLARAKIRRKERLLNALDWKRQKTHLGAALMEIASAHDGKASVVRC
jgi:hypothetical protein